VVKIGFAVVVSDPDDWLVVPSSPVANSGVQPGPRLSHDPKVNSAYRISMLATFMRISFVYAPHKDGFRA